VNLDEIQTTDIWNLYEQGRNYARLIGMYNDTDRNHRFYNDDQWAGVKLKGIEPVSLNIVAPIIKTKVGRITSNIMTIVFNSENFENKAFRKQAEKICELLNKKASKVWEKDQLDIKVRKVCKDSAINSEGIMYVTYDEENQTPINEIIDKNDIYYGNENDSDIQSQPYILIKRRLPVISVQEMAIQNGVSEDKVLNIRGDKDTFEEPGIQAKYEKDDMVTVITKMYKENGTVHFAISTRCVDIKEDTDSGLELYPVAHMVWEERKGSARGEGEVKRIIPNQIEINKTLMRRLIVAKQTAYPTRVINTDKIMNPADIDKVGVTIKTKNGQTVDDVNRLVGVVNPSQMSPDVEKLQNDLVTLTRELAGAGDIATGNFNPEQASGKAIIAIQNAQEQPLIEQLSELKTFIEDIARIWLDHFITYSENGLTLEEENIDPTTGEEFTELVTIPQTSLEELQASVKVDVTADSSYDKVAREIAIENLLKAGFFNIENLGALKTYVKVLPHNAIAPKPNIEEAIEIMEDEQKKIAQINAQADMLKMRANSFLQSDVDSQASTLAEAMQQPTQETDIAAVEENNDNQAL
jgi:hypothetical protein